MPKKFNTLESWGQATKQAESENIKQQVDNIFEKSIKDDFDSIPVGSFKSNLPEINSISFVRPDDGKNKDILYAAIYSQNKDGKEISHNWAVLRNGHIYPKDKIPSELSKYKQEEIALEIVSLLERINPAFIHLTNLDVIPDQDEGDSRERTQGPKGPPIEKPIDLARKEFLYSQRGAKFPFANDKKGFRGYQGLLFDDFVYLENPIKDNAAFIIDLPEKVDMEAIEKEIAQKKMDEGEIEPEISKDELREATLKRYWEPISDKAKTRQQLMALGAQRFIHTPEKWQENVRQAIASRTK